MASTKCLASSFVSVRLDNTDKVDAALNLKKICESMKANEKCFADDYDAENVLWHLLDCTNENLWLYVDSISQRTEFLEWLIASGKTPDEFAKFLQGFNVSAMCGFVWNPNYLAYRCRTCSSYPSMSVCSDCFLTSNHEGHDFNMFRSGAGGACDCGDAGVMLESGFCPRHGETALQSKKQPPADTFLNFDALIPHILRCILCILSSQYKTRLANEAASSDPSNVYDMISPLVSLLQKLSDYGAAAKDRLSKVLLDSKSYLEYCQGVSHFKDKTDYIQECRKNFKNIASRYAEPVCSKEDADVLDCPTVCPDLDHKHYLDELMFWLIKLKFPQPMVVVLLSLLHCEAYKSAFIGAFAMHYTRVVTLLNSESMSTSDDTENGDSVHNRVVHISVQLLSSETTAIRLIKEYRFLRVMVASLYNTIKRCFTECKLNIQNVNFHLVADCSHRLMKNNAYWVTCNDLKNSLAHKNIVALFLRDPLLLDLYCGLVSAFQGMNPSKRELTSHVEYDQHTCVPAFQSEIEICFSLCETLLEHLDNKDAYDCILSVLQNCTCQVQEWFEAIQFLPPNCWKPPLLECCFHIPLHRMWVAFLRQGVKLDMQITLPSETFLRQLIMHPLALQVIKSELLCDMWVRNGASMKYQGILYVNSAHIFLDPDLLLLQTCATKINPEWLVLTFFERFHLVDWLSFSPLKPTKSFLRQEWEMPMLDGCLKLILYLTTNFNQIALTDQERLKIEIAHLLCQSDMTHSKIIDALSQRFSANSRYSSTESVEKILHEIADYAAPQFEVGGSMSAGAFTPKNFVWDTLFDPLYISMRCFYSKDFQTTMDRYEKYLRSNGLTDKECKTVLPPYRIPDFYSQSGNEEKRSSLNSFANLKRILYSRSLHAIIFSVLLKAVNGNINLSDEVLIETIALLEIIVQITLLDNSSGALNLQRVAPYPNRPAVIDLQFCGWFTSNSIFENLCHKIERILCVDNIPGLSRSSQSEAEHGEFPDLIRMRAKAAAPDSYTTIHEDTPASSSSIRLKHSRSIDIPYIDSGMEVDNSPVTEEPETDYFYNRALSFIPRGMRARYALTMGSDGEAGHEATMQDQEDQLDQLEAQGATRQICVTTQNRQWMVVDAHDQSIDTSSTRPALEHSARLAIEAPSTSGALVPVSETDQRIVPMETESSPSAQSSQALSPTLSNPIALPLLASQPKPVSFSTKRQPRVMVTEVDRCMLDLLIVLHDQTSKLTKRTACRYSPPPIGDDPKDKSSSEVVSGVNDLLKRLLDWIYRSDGNCRRFINSQCPVTATGPPKSQAEEESHRKTVASIKPVDKKREAMRQRQERMMKQFKSQQKGVFTKLVEKEAQLIDKSKSSSSTNVQNEMLNMAESEYEHDSQNAVQCVICNCPAGASWDYPLGLIVSAQPTSLLSHQTLKPSPTTCGKSVTDFEDAYEQFTKADRRGTSEDKYFGLFLDDLGFDMSHVAGNWSNCWKSTVYIQTCGHYVHADCHETYLTTLKSEIQRARVSLLLVNEGEFHCPLCRRFSNAIMPIFPPQQINTISERRPEESDSDRLGALMTAFISYDSKFAKSKLLEMCKSFIKKIQRIHCRLIKLNEETVDEMVSYLLPGFYVYKDIKLCLLSVLRANLDMLTILKSNNLEPRCLCIDPLIKIASVIKPDQSQLFASGMMDLVSDCNALLLGSDNEKFDYLLDDRSQYLVRDLKAMFLHAVSTVMKNGATLDDYHLLVKYFLTMVSAQISATYLQTLNQQVKMKLIGDEIVTIDDLFENAKLSTLFKLFLTRWPDFVVPKKYSDDISMADAASKELQAGTSKQLQAGTLKQLQAGTSKQLQAGTSKDTEADNAAKETMPETSKETKMDDSAEIEQEDSASKDLSMEIEEENINLDQILTTLQNAHLDFLQFASMIKLHGDWIEKPAFDFGDVQLNFKNANWLRKFVIRSDYANSELDRDWPIFFTQNVLETECSKWIDKLDQFDGHNALLLKYRQPIWHEPELMPLPPIYETLFRKFYQKPCPKCHQQRQTSPSEPLLCLLCGKLVCGGEDCCLVRMNFGDGVKPITESELHALQCAGGGACIYLNILACLIIVYRGKRAAIWGSLYLDAHGEEDRNLKRGKPLKLCPERFALLKRHYYTHSFDDVCKNWFWIGRLRNGGENFNVLVL